MRARRCRLVRLLAKLAFAQIVVLPAQAKVDDRAGGVWLGCGGQAGTEHRAVGCLVADRAEGEPEGVLNQAGKRWFDELGDLRYLGQGHGGEAVLVEQALEQPHGLLADRSRGDEQD